MSKIIGIDLGTTNSVVSVMEGGQAVVVPNQEGGRTTPSVVAFTKTGERLVGTVAKRQSVTNPENTIYSIKRFMGRRFSEVSEEMKLVPYKVVAGENGDARVEINGKRYSPPEISAMILAKLKEAAEAYLGEKVTKAVITVPAYFNDAQRQATKDAGRVAGLEVMRIINEPTAAALAYGLQKTGVTEDVLIYDLGDGMCDVRVARITPDEIAVLSTAGDHDLGGKNWDDRIATFLAERFAAETGFDPLDDPVALNEVLVRSEQAKWALSERASTRVTLQLGTERQTFERTRAEFEAMTVPLMERTRRLTEEALGEAGLNWPGLDGVLLVGG